MTVWGVGLGWRLLRMSVQRSKWQQTHIRHTFKDWRLLLKDASQVERLCFASVQKAWLCWQQDAHILLPCRHTNIHSMCAYQQIVGQELETCGTCRAHIDDHLPLSFWSTRNNFFFFRRETISFNRRESILPLCYIITIQFLNLAQKTIRERFNFMRSLCLLFWSQNNFTLWRWQAVSRVS